MKKALSMLIGSVAAFVIGTVSAAAADVSLDTKTAVESADGVSFSVNSNSLSASQFTADTTLTVSCDAADADSCPIKLVLNYWGSPSPDNFSVGQPTSAEVNASDYKDGKAVYNYSDITDALGDAELSSVYSIEVVSAGSAVTCTGFDASNVYSQAELAEKQILHTVCVHPNNPKPSQNWGQSLTVGVDQLDISSLTPDSIVVAVFDFESEEEIYNSPVEFILQSTDDNVSPKAKNGTVWGKVPASYFAGKYAYFEYADIVDAYGTDDFSCVSTLYVGDTGMGTVTCTDLFALKCKTLAPDEPETPEVTDESSKEEAFTTTTKPAESAADQTSAAAASSTGESSSSTGNNIVLIIIGVVGGLVLAGVLVFILLGRKSKEAYDVNRHKFIKK